MMTNTRPSAHHRDVGDPHKGEIGIGSYSRKAGSAKGKNQPSAVHTGDLHRLRRAFSSARQGPEQRLEVFCGGVCGRRATSLCSVSTSPFLNRGQSKRNSLRTFGLVPSLSRQLYSRLRAPRARIKVVLGGKKGRILSAASPNRRSARPDNHRG